MPTHISPLDNTYVSLKRAAQLTARDQPGVEPDEIMDLFKHALFAGEFERPETTVEAATCSEELNLPLLRIEAPYTGRARPRLALDCQPHEYFAVKVTTIAEILAERDALPGAVQSWAAFTVFPRDPEIAYDMHHTLARIPYSAFPTKARAILGEIYLTKVKLRAWMIYQGYEVPAFLRDVRPPRRRELHLLRSCTEGAASKAARGRPRKAAWACIEALITEMYAADRKTPHKALAFDALEKTKSEFDEKDLPALGTIERRMKSILKTDD